VVEEICVEAWLEGWRATRVVGYLADISGLWLGYLKAVEGNCCLEASQEGWTLVVEDIVVEVFLGDLKIVEVYLRRREALMSH
jgi:hypothetical protein